MTSLFDQLPESRRDELLAEWLRAINALSPTATGLTARQPVEALYRAVLAELGSAAPSSPDAPAPNALADALNQWVAEAAHAGGSPGEPLRALLHLKQILLQELLAVAPATWMEELTRFERVFDALALVAFDAFAGARERLITSQSLSLIELATPVLWLWHQVLLLPLIGVVDTLRASQITDKLLEAIVRHEARVTIVDLSGVPVLDTSVAQHLMKTIDAARLLGTRIVMTGISPEGAQTLTKLGIHFNDVISRATLRAGIAEALLMVGRRISPIPRPTPESLA